MKAARYGSFAIAITMVLAACVSLGEQAPRRYFVLEPVFAAAERSANPRSAALIVGPTTASTFYETTEIAYSRAAGERAYYTQSSWTERPSRRISELLVARLQASGAFKAVAHAGSGVQGELTLNTHLAAFYHDAASPPGHVRVAIVAELVDVSGRALIARNTFEETAPAPTHDASGAVAAFNQATAPILGQIVRWVERTAPR